MNIQPLQGLNNAHIHRILSECSSIIDELSTPVVASERTCIEAIAESEVQSSQPKPDITTIPPATQSPPELPHAPNPTEQREPITLTPSIASYVKVHTLVNGLHATPTQRTIHLPNHDYSAILIPAKNDYPNKDQITELIDTMPDYTDVELSLDHLKYLLKIGWGIPQENLAGFYGSNFNEAKGILLKYPLSGNPVEEVCASIFDRYRQEDPRYNHQTLFLVADASEFKAMLRFKYHTEA